MGIPAADRDILEVGEDNQGILQPGAVVRSRSQGAVAAARSLLVAGEPRPFAAAAAVGRRHLGTDRESGSRHLVPYNMDCSKRRSPRSRVRSTSPSSREFTINRQNLV